MRGTFSGPKLNVEVLESRRVLAGASELIANLNTRGFGPDAIDHVATTSSAIYATVREAEHGSELWVTDGTLDGTRLLKDIAPGGESSFPVPLVSVGDSLFFSAETPARGRELWVTDGSTEGTVPLPEVAAGEKGVIFTEATVNGNNLYYLAEVDGARQLWRSDSTAGGTHRVAELSDARFLTTAGGSVFFRNETPETGGELWTSDGTPEGTRMVVELFPGPFGSFGPGEFVDFQDRLLMGVTNVGNGSVHQLWQSDGTAAGTTLIKDFGDLRFGPTNLTVFRDAVYFTVGYDDDRIELWRTDGSGDGTEVVMEVRHKDFSERPLQLTPVGDRLFFLARGFGTDGDLWVTDGTAEGTTQLTGAETGGPSGIREFQAIGGLLFFRGTTAASGSELWVSDGTVEGTRIVKELSLGNASPAHLRRFGDQLVFAADGLGGRELYITDGTEDGTRQATDIVKRDHRSDPTQLTVVGNQVFMRADDANFGYELFVANSMTGETRRLTDINAGTRSTELSWFTPVGDTLYFVADDASGSGRELWKSDGTPEGTRLVRDIIVGQGSSNPRNLAAAGTRLFFATDLGVFVTDGSDAGTDLLTESIPQTGIISTGDLAFFSVNTPSLGRELWVSDGTSAGTKLLKNIRSGSGSSNPEELVNVNGTLFFRANDGVSGVELWKSDGTPNGTVRVKDIFPQAGGSFPEWIRPAGGIAFFTATDPTYGRELWRSDGTPDGTLLVRDLEEGPRSLEYAHLQAVGSNLFFRYDNALWVTNGTHFGTRFVSAVSPVNVTAFNGQLYFTAVDPRGGTDIWVSNVTPQGTHVVDAANSGTAYTNPSLPVGASNTLYFAADDPTIGRELWGFHLDEDCPHPLTFVTAAPPAGHLYSALLAGEISADRLVIEEVIEVRPGQRASFMVRGTDGLRPRVSVIAPDGQVIAGSNSNDNSVALLNGLALTGGGTFRVRVEGIDASTGFFNAEVLLNAIYELEPTGAANNTLAVAEPLHDSFVEIDTGIGQVAVVGETHDPDFFAVNLRSDQASSFTVHTEQGAVDLAILDPAGTLLATKNVPSTSSGVLQEFAAPVDGTYFARITGDSAPYTLLVARGAAIDGETNDTLTSAVTVDASHRAIGSIGDEPAEPAVARFPPIRLTDGEGNLWPVNSQGIEGSDSFSYAINSLMVRSASISNYAVEDQGREVVVGPDRNFLNLLATRKVYVPEDAGFVRFLETAHNPTNQRIVASFGVDTLFHGQSSAVQLVGETTLDGLPATSDNWMVFDDADGAGMPAATFVWGQEGEASLTHFEPDFRFPGRDGFNGTYAVELQPGETKSVMLFVAQSPTRVAAIEKAQALLQLAPAAALRGLTEAEMRTVVNFHVPIGDFYSFAASAGDFVTLDVVLPQLGALQHTNAPIPRLELLDATGTLVASNPQGESSLAFTVNATGKYFARVASLQGSGTYVLRIDGATARIPFELASISPEDGIFLETSPQTVTVEFGQTIYLPSVDAADLSVDGMAATNVEIVDGSTLRFSIPTLASGNHVIRIAERALRDIRGIDSQAFESTFVSRPGAAQVVNSSILAGSVHNVGDVAVALKFDQAIQGHLLVEDDFLLTGRVRGRVAAGAFSYDAAAETVSFRFANLAEDSYELVLRSSGDAFRSLAGVPLDGDGDGLSGGDFSISFSTDIGTQTLPTPTALGVAGTGTAKASAPDRVISFEFDSDAFDMNLPETAMVSFVVQAQFVPTVRLVNLTTGVVVTEVSAENQHAIRIETLAARNTDYRLEVSGDGLGSYSVDAFVMATVELESLGIGDNNAIQSAEILASARTPVTLYNDAAQTAMVGHLIEQDRDYVQFDHDPTTTFSVMATGLNGGAVESLRLFDPSGNLLFVGEASDVFDYHVAARWTQPNDARQFVVEVAGLGDYYLGVRENYGFDLERNSEFAIAQELGTTGRVTGEVASGGILLFARELTQQGLYIIDGTTAQAALVGESATGQGLVGLSPAKSPDSLYVDNYDQFFELSSDGSGQIGESQQTELLFSGLGYDARSDVLYGATTEALYRIDPATGRPIERLAEPRRQIIGLAFGHGKLYAVHQGDTMLAEYDPRFDVWREVGDTGIVWSEGALAYDSSTKQLFAKRRGDTELYRIDSSSAETTAVGRITLPDGSSLGSLGGGLAVIPQGIDPTGNHFTVGVGRDVYRFELPATDRNVSISVSPVVSATGSEGLSPSLQLFDGDGQLLVSSEPSSSNTPFSLALPRPVGGVYFAVVDGSAHSSGLYALTVDTDNVPLLAQKPTIVGSTPDLSRPLEDVPESLTVHFNSPILASSIRPEDLTLSGVPATSLEFVTADSVRFALPTLLPGVYAVELGGEIVDAMGQMVKLWMRELVVPVERLGPVGSWLKRSGVTGDVESGSSHTVFLNVEEPQPFVISLAVSPSLAPQITVRAPSGQVIATGASLAGQGALLSVNAATTGIHSIEIAGNDATQGTFDLSTVYGGELEVEPNDFVAAPQSLDNSLVPLSDVADRVSVMGVGDGQRYDLVQRVVFEQVMDQHTFTFEGLPRTATGGAIVRMEAIGAVFSHVLTLDFEGKTQRDFTMARREFTTPAQGFAVVSLSQRELASLLADGTLVATVSGFPAVGAGYSFQLSIQFDSFGTDADHYSIDVQPGDSIAIGARAIADGQAAVSLLDLDGNVVAAGVVGDEFDQTVDFITTTGGTLVVRVQAVGEYALTMGKNATFDRERNHAPADAQPLDPSGVAFGGISPVGTLYFVNVFNELFLVDSTNANTQFVDVLTSQEFDEFRQRLHVNPQNGLRYKRDNSEFIIEIDPVTDTFRPLPPSPTHIQEIAVGPNGIYVVGAGSGDLGFFDFSSESWSIVGDTGREWGGGFIEYDWFNDVLYAIQPFESTLFQIDARTAELMPIGDLPSDRGSGLAFFAGEVDPTGYRPTTIEFGDRYQLSARSGDSLVIETRMPPLPGNLIDPKLELFDSRGNLLQFDSNGVPDGRNARVEYTATENSPLHVLVTSENNKPGAYSIVVTGALRGTDLVVNSTVPADAATLDEPPTSITLQLSDRLDAGSIDAGDLRIDGVAATSVRMLDGRTLQVSLPPLLAGYHQWTLDAGVVRSIFGQPSQGFGASFYVPSNSLGPELGQAYLLPGTVSLGPESQVEVPIPLDDDQTFGAIITPSEALAVQAELLDPRGISIATVSSSKGARVSLPAVEIGQTGTHLLRLTSLDSSLGEVHIQGLLNATTEQEAIGGSSNNARETAEIIRTRNITDGQTKLGLMQGALSFASPTVRRAGGLHGGSPVLVELRLEQDPEGPGQLQVIATADMRGADRFVTVEIEGRQPQQFFVTNGGESDNTALVPLSLELLQSVKTDDGVLNIRMTPSRAVGDTQGFIAATIDYPTQRFNDSVQLEGAAIGGRTTSTTFPLPEIVFQGGNLRVTARGDFAGASKSLQVRLDSNPAVTLFADEGTGTNGVFTAEIPLTLPELVALAADRRLLVRLTPSAAVQEIAGNSIGLELDFFPQGISVVDGFGEGMNLRSPTHFRIPAGVAATGDGVLSITSRGFHFPFGAKLDLDVEGRISTQVFGIDVPVEGRENSDSARQTVRIPIPQATLRDLQSDGFIDLSLTLSGPVDLLSDRFVEAQLDYATDEDFFRFDLDANQLLNFGVDLDRHGNDVELNVLNAAGDLVAEGRPERIFEQFVEFTPPAAGEYFVHLVGRGDYKLVAGVNVALEHEGEATQAFSTDLVTGALRGQGGLIYAEEPNSEVFILDSDSGESGRMGRFPSELVRDLLGAGFDGRDLFAGVDHENGFVYVDQGDVRQHDLNTSFLTGFYFNVTPPGIMDVAFGGGRLFGISDRSTLLYAFDPSTGRWSTVGDTGRMWTNGGLAYDDANDVLYALGRGSTQLFSIDPRRGTTTPIGQTGLINGGKLAYYENLREISTEFVQSGDRFDAYEFEASAGDQLVVSRLNSGAGPLAPTDTELTLELTSPTGNVVGTTAANEAIRHDVALAGTYSARLTPSVLASGNNYLLSVTGQTGDPRLILEPRFPGTGILYAEIEEVTTATLTEYAFGVEAGETISIRQLDSNAAQPTLSLIDPQGRVMVPLPPPAASDSGGALLRFVSAERGDYTLRAEGQGKLVAQVFVGASVESEGILSADNNSRSTSERIDLTAGGSGTKATIVGAGGGSSPDYYRLAASAGRIYDFALATEDASAQLTAQDAGGNTIARGQPTSRVFQQAVGRFVSSTDTEVFVRIDADSDYALVVTRDLVLNTGPRTPLLAGISQAIGSVEAAGVLFFAEDDAFDRGLWVLDANNGQSWSAGSTGSSDDLGLAPSGSVDAIIGSYLGSLGRYRTDGTGVDLLPGNVSADALAYDPVNHQLYATRSGAAQLLLVDPDSGVAIRELATPPLGVTGLAFGNGGVYALGSDSFFASSLYFYDPMGNTWSVVGQTGRIWQNVGLAYNPFTNQLYAKQSFDTRLYSIDPTTAQVSVIGDTGIRNGGGLAFVPQAIDPTGNGATFSRTNSYTVALEAADYQFVTAAVYYNSAVHVLDARLEIYDQSGQLLAADEDGAADGVNASLRFSAPAAGVYEVRVSGENGTSGSYQLIYSALSTDLEAPDADPASFRINAGAAFRNRLDTLSMTFSEEVVVDPESLVIRDSDGLRIDTSAVEITVNGRSVTWNTTSVSLEPGSYRVILQGQLVQDLAGNSMTKGVFMSTFSLTEFGDANLDGRVGFDDFLTLSSNFGSQEGTWWRGDFDGDTRVGFADFLSLSANFGKDIGGPVAVLAGDVDYSGHVGFDDFLVLAANFGRKDASWFDGDFNGDGEVSFVDFLIESSNFGRTLASPVSSAFAEAQDWWFALGPA